MGRLVGVSVVPSAPLVSPTAVPAVPADDRDEVEGLRAAARDAVGRLAGADAVVLLATGQRAVHDRARVDLRPLGIPDVTREHPVPRELLPDLTSRAQYAQRHADHLEVDLAVLALQLREGEPVVPIGVPPADGDALAAVGVAVVDAVQDADRDVAILVAGDLSAALGRSSPRYLVPGAATWDATTVAALQHADLDGLVEQGHDAARVHARSWAPLVVAVAAARAAHLRAGDVGYHTARGVGHAVGHLAHR